jgi:hypothetical protein
MGDELTVLSITVGRDEIYKVTQEHCMTYTVNSAHPLSLHIASNGNMRDDKSQIIILLHFGISLYT